MDRERLAEDVFVDGGDPPQIPRLWTMLMWCVVFGSS